MTPELKSQFVVAPVEKYSAETTKLQQSKNLLSFTTEN